MKYKKPHLSYQDQLSLLLKRGLQISENDKQGVKDILKTVGYYRLSAYFLPFQSQKDTFNPNTTFQKIYTLYDFDSQLRSLLLSALEPIEIVFRTVITYYLSDRYSPFGYTNAENFAAGFKHSPWLENLEEEVARSHEVFIKHYQQKYRESPHFPLWMISEVMSFGSLSKIFSGLKYRDKKSISKKLSVHPDVLQSWLHCFVYVRNLCAHHSRVWNRQLSIRPRLPFRNELWKSLNNKRIFSILTIMNYCFNKLEINYKFKEKLNNLLSKYPEVNFITMGMNNTWSNHILWNKLTDSNLLS